MGDHSIAGPECLNQRGVGPTNTMSVKVGACVKPERLHDRAFKYRAHETDLWPRRVQNSSLVLCAIASVRSQHYERNAPRPERVCTNHLKDVVLRFRSGDNEVIFLGFQIMVMDQI